ncbi:AraC family transcriptional regulator [Paenibacillus athensensis]|uniref:AraC family transcriptional regulator n=1 Tax=Paenibacillus athensensis TaxID=1967502 RepID=A0A4Y8PTK0_9BACL|nr:AraC family transcriptional regulator [Paenibacillus athensensis]MCD1261773.1 AraC family transcriptional regulator [Paenibacillus athensensis]
MNKELLREKRQHGSPLHPVSVYDIACPPDVPLLPLHWHDELELFMLTQGRAVLRVGLAEYELKAGEAVFINSGELHAGFATDGQECSFVAVVFHSGLLGGPGDPLYETYLDPLLRGRYTVPVHWRPGEPEHAGLLALLQQAAEAQRAAAPVFELLTRGLLQQLVANLLRLGGPAPGAAASAADRLKLERLKTVARYMQEHYAEPIRLGELAALVSVNESYLCRFFKELTQQTPMEYLHQVRVQQAALLLAGGSAKVMDVALDTGFHHLSYFIAVFKQHFGCTPSAYRKREQAAQGSGQG